MQEPKTLESMREFDDTAVLPGDAEVAGDEADDEFARVWDGTEPPKVMVTTAKSPSGKIFPVIAELLNTIPNSFYYKRGHFELKKICEYASNKAFTHLLVLSERRKIPNGMILIKLPDGPTAAFKLRSTVLPEDIRGHGRATTHVPEVLLNRFTTRLGRRIGRLLGSLFPVRKAEFEGRQVVTFHNQRDFIFFRRHRYIFEDAPGGGGGAGAAAVAAGAGGGGGGGKPDVGAELGKRVRMQELGPRFTLKLKYLMASTFDTRFGEYEWLYHRHDMETSRRKFQL